MTDGAAKCCFCGKTLDEHVAERRDGAPVPRMPCLGLRSGFMPRKPTTKGRSRRYVRPASTDPSSSVHVVSSAEVTEIGAHELVRVWSRGGLAGELIVSRGDGARLCCVMLMLEPEADDRA